MDKHLLFSKIKKSYRVKTGVAHYIGNNSLNAVLRMLERAAERVSMLSGHMPVFLLSVPEGQGAKTAARLLAKRLSALQKPSKRTGVRYYKLVPEDASINLPGTINDILKSIESEAGFFYCIINLDVYTGKRVYDPLVLKLLELIGRTGDRRGYILLTEPMEREAANAMLDYLSNYICVKLIELQRLSPQLALKHTEACMFSEHGAVLSPAAEEAFIRYFRRWLERGKYLGFSTLERMRDEMYFNYTSDPSERIEARHIEKNAVRIRDEQSGSDALDELDAMIGLDEIKAQIKEIVKTTTYRKQSGIDDKRTLHLMFTGAPGTGKSAVAKLIGRIMRDCGVLPGGRLIEVTRKDLIGEYLGQTALKTIDVCRMAIGNVLFIDEAYSLAKPDNDRYGFEQECLTTLLAEMENKRDKFIVIMAGYKDEMEQLCRTNAGLRDRFAFKIDFPPYTREQLVEIFVHQLKSRSYRVSDEAMNAANTYMRLLPESVMRDKNFSNARFIRNFTERIISKLAIRVINGRLEGDDDLIIESDISQTLEDNDFKKLNTGKDKRSIGF